MNKSETINDLATALSVAQGQMTAAKMGAENPFLHNHYADLGSVIQAAKKPLADNGLSYSQHPELNGGAVTITTILMHSTGQWIESTITLGLGEGKGMSQAQQMGSVITYLRRYSLSAILGIYADEDTDGNDKTTIPHNGQARPAQTITQTVNPQAIKPLAAPVSLTGKPAVITEARVEEAQATVDAPATQWPEAVLQYFVDTYKLRAKNQAENMLNLSDYPKDTPVVVLAKWVEVYKSYRAIQGEGGVGKYTTHEAAQLATTHMNEKG
jgi:hypothetical protein